MTGVALAAEWTWRDVAGALQVPELNTELIDEARDDMRVRWKLSVGGPGRMVAEMSSLGPPLAPGSQLRARLDRYGTVLVWPGRDKYRVVPPGALRALLDEGRLDAAPLSEATTEAVGEGERLGRATRIVKATTAVGVVTIHFADVPASGDGATLLCRLLIEVAGGLPSARVCVHGALPVAAHYRWPAHPGAAAETALAFEAVEVRGTELESAAMQVPPARARASRGVPLPPGGELLDAKRLGEFRTGGDSTGAEAGLWASNQSDRRMVLLVDGVSVATVAPWDVLALPSLKPGRYNVQWRSFLGDEVGPTEEVTLPGRTAFGVRPPTGADAGT